MTPREARRGAVVLLLLASLASAGCAARMAYRSGQSEARKGNWDLAVARLTKALEKDPDNIGYKIALENARIQASRHHQDLARRALAASDLDKAAEEMKIATDYDPSNKAAADELAGIRDRLAKRDAEKTRLTDFEAMKARVQASRPGVPVLSPRSTAPIRLHFPDTSLQKVLETLGKLAGVNVLFDFDYRDKRVDVDLSGLTFQEALDRLTFTNRLFYKVLDQNTIIIVPESPAKRRTYDEVLLRVFYLQNAETKDLETIIKQMLGTSAKVASNAMLGSITIIGTVDQLALAERVIAANDKARGEVMVEVEILEVNRNRLKRYGIELSNYQVSADFAPNSDTVTGTTSLRAHLLSSFNLADFVVNIPSSLFMRFLQTDSTVRLLASPRLRAAEGKPTKLSVGTEVPVPVTTFTAAQTGGTTFAPATSFNYRNVGVNLQITPRVNASGEINLELAAEFSQIGDRINVGSDANPFNVPSFLSRKVEGVIRVRDGETSLIGGLVQGRDATSLTGVLGLQSIPILNKIFTSTNPKEKNETEVIISLTPHLVRAPRLVEEDLASLYVGSAERVIVPTARPPLFGQPDEVPLPPVPIPAPTPVPPPPSPSPAAPPPETGVEPSIAAPPARPVPPGTVMEPAGAPAVPAGERRGVTAAVSPAEASLKVGETSNVSVVLLNAQNLNGVEMTISYDPALLETVDVSPGPLLTLDGAAVGVERNLEPGRARVKFSRATGASGSGMVATVTFRALRQGAGAVTVESLSIATTTGTEQIGVASPVRVVVSP
jgi:general secretion pathway protein D